MEGEADPEVFSPNSQRDRVVAANKSERSNSNDHDQGQEINGISGCMQLPKKFFASSKLQCNGPT